MGDGLYDIAIPTLIDKKTEAPHKSFDNNSITWFANWSHGVMDSGCTIPNSVLSVRPPDAGSMTVLKQLTRH